MTASHAGYQLLEALTIVLGVAAVTTLLFQRLRQPVVLGYILAGLIIGPHVPIPLVADPDTVVTLSELGVILLMFSIGLEFSLRRLIKVGPTAGLTAVIQSSLMVWLGFVTARLLGWSTLESLFAGAIVAISSTTIIAKAFDEQRIGGPLRELVVGILIVEDLIAVLLMAALTAVASGVGLSAGALASTLGRLAGFLVGLLALGLLVVPRAVRAIVRLGRPETLVIASVGICFGVALLAHAFGYSVALGAFIAGSLVAESGEGERIERLVQPIRDMFAAVFFVSVGMLIDPRLIAEHWLPVVVFTVLVVVGKVAGVSLGAFLTGSGTRRSVEAGMSLAQIGEFSFIIAGLGASLGATRDFVYPVAAAVSAITTLTTPWMIRASGPFARFVDRKLPREIQTFASLYSTWLERLRGARGRATVGARLRRLVGLLVVDTAFLAALAIGVAVELDRLGGLIARHTPLGESVARAVVVGAAVALAVPFALGVLRISARLGRFLAELALPLSGAGPGDLGRTPRRALVVVLQIACVLAAAAPLFAIVQPFLPSWPTALALVGLLVALGVAFWRRATDLQGHVRAGARIIVEALATQAGSGMDHVGQVLPGIGEPVQHTLAADSGAVGKSLAELDLRGVTGATVLVIYRAGGSIVVPTAGERLQAGDVLALAGTHEAIAAARERLA